MSSLRAAGFGESAVRARALTGVAAAFPDPREYGAALFGAQPRPAAPPGGGEAGWDDPLDRLRLVPPVFMPRRLDKLIELAREPVYQDVVLETEFGGLRSPLPVYVSAFGSTRAASIDLGVAAARQAARLGLPMVIGENVMPVDGYGRLDGDVHKSLLGRIGAYRDEALDGHGGVVVQQSTEDADAEVWNAVYSDPNARPLLESGRLAFELKVGQGAKPGLGGMTVLDAEAAARLAGVFTMDTVFGAGSDRVLRCSSPGTFTAEILHRQIQLMRNNYPRARVWLKLPPTRDVGEAVRVAWAAGADAVTVDGAEGGTGWAPSAFLESVGLPLGECLRRIGNGGGGVSGSEIRSGTRTGERSSSLLVSGRIWAGPRAAKCLALGADAVGLGRAALLAVDTDAENGLANLVDCLALELRMLISALGKYSPGELAAEDVWAADGWAGEGLQTSGH